MNIISHSKIKAGSIINWGNGKAFVVPICISFQKKSCNGKNIIINQIM